MTLSIKDTQLSHLAECRDLLIDMPNVFLLSVVMMSVVMLNVEAPKSLPESAAPESYLAVAHVLTQKET